MFKIYKELSKFISKKKYNKLISTNGLKKNLIKHFTIEDIQMANKHEKDV